MSQTWVPILMYHALDVRSSLIALTPERFAWQMQWLYAHGFQTLSLSQLAEALANKARLPSKAVVLTFDDGFASTYQIAFPIMARYGFTATVFLVSGYCGRHNDWPDQPLAVPQLPLLTWEQVREMDHYGIEFGGHTIHHPWLDKLQGDDLAEEVLGSKQAIEEQLGHAISCFAYPYGRYNSAVVKAVSQTYRAACTTQLGIVDAQSNPLLLERIEMLYMAHPWIFPQLATSFLPRYLDLRRLLRSAANTILRRAWK